MAKLRKVGKVVAVVNAVLLAGGVIAYKAGAFAETVAAPAPNPEEMFSSSKNYSFHGLAAYGSAVDGSSSTGDVPTTFPPSSKSVSSIDDKICP